MPKLQVLVLDDEPIVGKRLKLALSKMGCEVEAYDDPALWPENIFFGVA
jgi:hypothetical protein